VIKWLWERFQFRKQIKFPGGHLNLSKKLISKDPTEGVSTTFGGRLLSWNTRRRVWRANPPGPGFFVGNRRRKSK
jgi:hypothetical protein